MMKKIQKRAKPKLNKETSVMALAAVTAAAVAATGIYGLYKKTEGAEVYAKESFLGLKEIVEEHDRDNPFTILDISPARAMYIMDGTGKTYHLSTGTSGYLTSGQAPIEKDIQEIFSEDTAFYRYEEREALAKAIVPSGYEDADFLTIAYEEAYGGTMEGLDERHDWIKLYDTVGADGPADGSKPTGRLNAYATKTEAGEDGAYQYNGAALTEEEEEPADGVFRSSGDGAWHLIFAYDPEAPTGYVPSVSACDDLSSYSSTTGVYYKNEDGTYEYVGTKAQILDLPEENQRPPEDETEEEKKPGGDGDHTGGEGSDIENTGDGTTGSEDDGNTGSEGDDGSNTGSEGDDGGNTGSEGGDGGNTGSEGSDGGDTGSEGGDGGNTGSEGGDGGNTGSGGDDGGNAGSEGGDDGNTGNEGSDGGNTGSDGSNTGSGGVGDNTGSDGGSEGSEDSTGDGVNAGGNTGNKGGDTGGERTAHRRTASNLSWHLLVEEGEAEKAGPDYYILEFHYEDNPSDGTKLYRISEKEQVPDWDGAVMPYDRYDIDESAAWESDGTTESGADEEKDEDDIMDRDVSQNNLPVFQYVGTGGNYNLKAAYPGDEKYAEAKEVEVLNAPVYFRCCKGNNWLEKYVFNALEDQDNYYDQFAIEVISVTADKVDTNMVEAADLVYLEHGAGIFLDGSVKLETIGPGEGNGGMPDIADEAVLSLLYRAVTEMMPVIVDYDIIDNPGLYEDTLYHKLARIFLKEDLAGFYYDMGREDLLDDLLRGLESDDYEDKEDNNCHYVNRNVYMVSGSALVDKDFSEAFAEDVAKRGFGEVLTAIRAENTMLKEEDWLKEEVSKARAVAYIINYAVGMIGDYRDVSILELQPSANLESDLHVEVNDDRQTTTLYWRKKDSEENGQQIFRSTKMVEVSNQVKSVAAFNGEWQDINSTYDMVFIGLDGQRLNQDGKDNHTVYNDEALNGLVYHTGDRIAGSDARYDASDITAQKKEALLDFLRAGYPIVLENNCVNVKKSDTETIRSVNKRYIAEDTQMYAFLEEALAYYGDYLYTVRDVRGNPEFRAQLNVVKPRIASLEETPPVQNLERAQDGKYQGTIQYYITGNQDAQEDTTYHGDTALRLYLDMNYDGYFAPSEELYPTGESGGYLAGEGQVTVLLEGVESGIIPWKLEVSDTNNGYRRDAMMGYFAIQGHAQHPVNILQILDEQDKKTANLQMQFEKLHNATLGRYLEMAQNKLNVTYEIETITTQELQQRLTKNSGYLRQWDVLVLGFGNSGPLGEAESAVTDYINEGRSVLISYAGASEETGRLGLDMALLGQTADMTYSKLGRTGGGYYRYSGLDQLMFEEPKSSLQVEKINEGSICHYPFEVGSEEGAILFSGVTELMAPEYLLDFTNNTRESEVHVTGWYTLKDNSPENGGGYQVSPRDARNNYYIYSRANVVYVGQNEYPYFYEKDAGEEPKEGVEECRLFVNALTAAYHAGIHNPRVDIVAGFGDAASSVESIPIPFDQELKLSADIDGGILDETVDVYFKFVDHNIAFDKATDIAFYYENGTNPEAELVLEDGSINTVDFTVFGSPVWMVENNHLVEVTDGFRQGAVYRIKAPVVALKGNDAEVSRIFIALSTSYVKGGKEGHVIGTDAIALTRAQMFLLE